MRIPFYDLLPWGVCRFSDIGELKDCRAKSRVPENAQSVIMYLFPYYLGEEYYENINISKYAVPLDYHITAGVYLQKAVDELRALYPHNKFEYFCDNSPVYEVEAAVKCGLGVKGRNSLLINKKYGSFCFIGEIITDLALDCTLPEDRACLSCGRCEKACPGGALCGYKVDNDKCLSHITQLKAQPSDEQIQKLRQSSYIWGCDVCQDVCPMNKNISVTPVKEFYCDAKAVFSEGDTIENRAFGWRGEAVINRNLKISCCKD